MYAGQLEVLSLTLRCDNSSHGCEWVGELCSLDKHLAICGFTLLPCPNECHQGGGNVLKVVELLRKDVEKHTKEECPRRQYMCPHCQETGEYQKLTTKHIDECPMMEVPCPRRKCKVRIRRRDLLQHRQECPFEKLPCKYVTIGCTTEVLRKDLAEHEGDTQLHLQLAIETVHKQQSILQSRQMPMKYKFSNFEHYKASATERNHSPAFYTSPGGYKMCIRVYANGAGDGKGSHISVYAYLMKGENDDHLPWPFTGTVTVELLNQIEDKNHFSRSTKFLPENAASQRVMNQEQISFNGYGQSRYFSHSALGYNTTTNNQYLMNDCLYFRISVDAETSSKPWLI